MKRYAIGMDELYPLMILEKHGTPYYDTFIELTDEEDEAIDVAYREFHKWNTFLENKWREAVRD